MNTGCRPPTIADYLTAPAHPMRQKGGCRAISRQKSKFELPLVSIVTFVRNGGDTIEQTIRSVRKQTYPNVEYIVTDGASTDGTVEILQAQEHVIDCWLSEPDCGATDALNKAIAYSTGDYVFMLSSNDWIPPDFIENGVQALQRSNADFVFGDVLVYEGDTMQCYAWSDPDYATKISWLPSMAPGAAILRRKLFEQLGLFDLRYKFASDVEWMVRLHASGGQGVHDNKLVLNYRRGGISETHYLNGLLEVRRAVIAHGYSRTKATLGLIYYGSRYLLKLVLQWLLPKILFSRLMRLVRKTYSRRLPPSVSC